LVPVHELNHIVYVLQKLKEEINDFKEMLPRPDKRRAVLSAVGSMLKWGFGTTTLVDVEKLHRSVDKMHRTEGNIIHSVNHQMTYVKSLDSAIKFNTEAVGTLSERVKTIKLDWNKWKDETDIDIHWLNYALYNQSNTFTYVRQLEFAILELRTMVKEILISLDSTMTGKLSMNLIPPLPPYCNGVRRVGCPHFLIKVIAATTLNSTMRYM
jgi:DNA gyrase/topoisomerase IV subunit A